MSKKKVEIIEPTTRFDGSSLSEKKITRVAAYARVSTDKEDQLNSLETQRAYFVEHINKNPDWTFVEIYYDEGISGLSTKKRVGFNRMIQDALDGKIDLILSKSISRFARNVIDTLTITRLLKTRGIPVFFEKESINTFDPNGEFLLNFMASFAEEESKSISKNIRWAKKQKFQQGCVSVPYSHFLGYKQGANKYEMVIDKEQAKIVKLIYRLFLNGYSTSYVRDYLNEQHIHTPAGLTKWTVNVIASILSNEKYIGDAVLQKSYIIDIFSKKQKENDGELRKYYVTNDHPAIIKEDTFVETHEQLIRRKNIPSSQFLLSCRLYCKKCERFYRKNYWYNKNYPTTIIRWQCANKFTNVRCNNITLYEDELYYALNQLIAEIQKAYVVDEDLGDILVKTIKEPKRAVELKESIKSNELPNNKEMIEIFYRIAILKIDVYPKRVLKFYLVDGSVFTYPMPNWSIMHACPVPNGRKKLQIYKKKPDTD